MGIGNWTIFLCFGCLASAASLDTEDNFSQFRQLMPVVSRMLRPTIRSALESARRYVNYNVMGVTAVIVSTLAAALYWFPGAFSYVGIYAGGDNSTDVISRFDSILRRYNIDSDACMKVALCSVGRISGDMFERRSPIQVFDTMLSLTYMDEVLLNQGLRRARQVGEQGGDCDASFNKGGKCPFNAAAWKVLLTTINKSFL
ncbi:uncharacterized protein LOC135398729 [Ornithodoros turicata]|uniref:uncharacterized protein LOC135398729 n=1 Tax=Ornithodoros turicata TaxID=34597 RepID=UPI003138B971